MVPLIIGEKMEQSIVVMSSGFSEVKEIENSEGIFNFFYFTKTIAHYHYTFSLL